MSNQNTKWPRHYAAEIVTLPTREERDAALERVPAHLRPVAREHVADYFFRRKGSLASNTSPEAPRRAPSAGAVTTPAAPAARYVGKNAIAQIKGALA